MTNGEQAAESAVAGSQAIVRAAGTSLRSTDRANQNVIDAARQLTRAGSRTLLGILCGSVGTVVATALGTFNPVLLTLTPVFGVMGVVVGILMARGTGRIVGERGITGGIDDATSLRAEIAAAKADGIPKEHEDRLWNLHGQLIVGAVISQAELRALPPAPQARLLVEGNGAETPGVR